MAYHLGKTSKWAILIFYLVLILIASIGGEYFKGTDGFGYGMTSAMVVSIALWWIVGRNMAE